MLTIYEERFERFPPHCGSVVTRLSGWLVMAGRPRIFSLRLALARPIDSRASGSYCKPFVDTAVVPVELKQRLKLGARLLIFFSRECAFLRAASQAVQSWWLSDLPAAWR